VGDVAKRAGRGVTRMLVDGVLALVSLAILVGWGLQGVFWLDPGESAVIVRLGAYHRTRTIEGLGAHLPPPLESHVVVNVGQLQTESFGESPTRSTSGTPSDKEEKKVAEGLQREAIQTADHNVVHVSYELQYKIADGYAWAWSMADPAAVLHDATEAAMRSVVGKRTIDEVVAQNRSQIERDAERQLSEMLAAYATAVGHAPAFEVVKINLVSAQPPDEVREAFVDVVSAGQDEKRSTLAATGDASEIVERARSQAAEAREQAEAYRAATIVEAKGEAARFDALVVAYQAAPEVTRQRLYLETMEAILPGMEKVIVEPDTVNLWSSWPPPRSAADAPAVGAGPAGASAPAGTTSGAPPAGAAAATASGSTTPTQEGAPR